MSLIIAYSGNAETKGAAKETPNIILSEVNKDFFLDKNKIFRNIAFKKYFGLIFGSFLLLALFFLLTYFGERDSWFFLAGMAVCLLIYFFLVLFSLGRTKRKMPENIKLRTNEISLDEERFNFNEISKISLTPPSYYVGNINRNLKIYSYDGKKKLMFWDSRYQRQEKKIRYFLNMKSFSICWKEFSEIHPENFSMIYKKNDQKRKFCDIIEVNILMQSFISGIL